MKKLIVLMVLSLFVCGVTKATTAGDIFGMCTTLMVKVYLGLRYQVKTIIKFVVKKQLVVAVITFL